MSTREPARTPREVLALIRENEVKAVDLRFMDFPGLWQHFTIPAEVLDEDVVRGRPRLRRLQHPRLAGDQRVRHARRARSRTPLFLDPFCQRRHAGDDLQHPGPAHQGGLHPRPAERRPQGRQLHEVAPASPTPPTSARRSSSSSSTTCGSTRRRTRRSTTSTAAKARGTPAATRGRTSATRCRYRAGVLPVPADRRAARPAQRDDADDDRSAA